MFLPSVAFRIFNFVFSSNDNMELSDSDSLSDDFEQPHKKPKLTVPRDKLQAFV